MGGTSKAELAARSRLSKSLWNEKGPQDTVESPAPIDRQIIHDYPIICRVLSQVVQEFFHQQYDSLIMSFFELNSSHHSWWIS